MRTGQAGYYEITQRLGRRRNRAIAAVGHGNLHLQRAGDLGQLHRDCAKQTLTGVSLAVQSFAEQCDQAEIRLIA